jgi:cytochrome c-type biogenesis protein CcmH/NrfF
MRRALALVFVLAAVAPAGALAAAAADFNDVEDELMCDTCNVALNIAESTRADQERAQIRRLIAQGKTKQQILDTFVAEYGPNVLTDPTKGGGSPAVWAVPLAILLAAAIAVALLLPRWRRRRRNAAGEDPPDARALSKDDEDRLQRDLALYDL